MALPLLFNSTVAEFFYCPSYNTVAAARAALGNQIPLMVDANSGYTSVEYAEPVAAMLRRYNVTWFEEPCVWNDLVCARQVRALDLVGG